MTKQLTIKTLSAIRDVCKDDHMETEAEALDMAIKALEQPEIIQCKNCYWWDKQKDSLQGRCSRYGFYPTGYWYCAGARERK